MLHKIPLQGLRVYGFVGFHHPNAAQHAHIGHALQLGAGGKPLAQAAFKLCNALLPVFFFQQVKACAGHRTGQGIGHKGGAVHKNIAPGANFLRHLVRAGRGRKRQHAAGERLAATQNVGRYARPLCGKHLARAAKAGGNFVKYQQGPGLAA